MQNYSKSIKKSDDSSKEFIINCLKGDKTYGFDIDSIYFDSDKGKYYIFEYLKCESSSVTPHTSEPKFYPYNWRKFHSLYNVAKKLNGTLILVNYSDGYKQQVIDGNVQSIALNNQEQYKNEVKLLYVESLDYKLIKEYEQSSNKQRSLDYIKYSGIKKITVQEFSDYLRKLNKECGNLSL